jgi:hypothetical protein
MNSKERILSALNNEQPDKVPICELYINESSIVRLAQILMPQKVKVEATKDRFGSGRYCQRDDTKSRKGRRLYH